MKAFGDRPAADVTTTEVSQFLRSLDHEGLTPRNVNKHREVLAAMFAYGSRSDTFALAANPVDRTDKRRQPSPAVLDYYEVEEVEALARRCERGRAPPDPKCLRGVRDGGARAGGSPGRRRVSPPPHSSR
jgi:site-specific recombinase XerD